MFETIRFQFNAELTSVFARDAVKASMAGNIPQVMNLATRAMKSGEKALAIKVVGDYEPARKALTDIVSGVRALYRRAFLKQMPERDREVVISVLRTLADSGIMIVGGSLIEQASSMFDIAKHRLGAGDKTLRVIYCGEQSPTVLRDIVQDYLAGTMTREEAEKRLDEGSAALKKWLPQMFPEEFPATK